MQSSARAASAGMLALVFGVADAEAACTAMLKIVNHSSDHISPYSVVVQPKYSSTWRPGFSGSFVGASIGDLEPEGELFWSVPTRVATGTEFRLRILYKFTEEGKVRSAASNYNNCVGLHVIKIY